MPRDTPPRRRLWAVAAALRSERALTGEVSRRLHPLPLDIDGGGVAEWKMDEIQGLKRAALQAEDYRLASEMAELHTVLSPSSGEDCALLSGPPSELEEEARFFFRFGFCVLRGVFAGDHLQRLRSAWRRAQRPFRQEWQANVADDPQRQEARRLNSTFLDLPVDRLYAGLVAQLTAGEEEPEDAVLLDLLDPPRLVALLKRILVTDQWTELRLPGLLQSRTYPPREDPGGDARGYIGWHRDHDGPGLGVSANPAAVIKAFTYFEDVDESNGATTVVPGSHVLTFDPRGAFEMQRGGVARPLSGAPAEGESWEDRPLEDDWTANTYQVQPQSAMANAHKIVCCAGDVALL